MDKKKEIFIFRFLFVRHVHVHERAFWMSLKHRTKKKNHKVYKIKKRNSNLKLFFFLSMDPDTALELVKQGATLLLLDVPQYTLLGIDTQSWKIGTRNDLSHVIVRRWDQLQERLVKVLEEEEERYCQAVKSLEFDRQLGPYNLSQYGDWKHLSNYITKSIIERIEPIGGEITVACESGIGTNTPKTAMEKALDEQMKSSKFLTSLDNSQSRRCYYTSIPHVIKQKGIHGQELTSLNIDKTQLLESLLIKDYGGSEDVLLGELICIYCIFGFVTSEYSADGTIT
ncbi:protein aar2 like protein [Quercus suber]|uniref:Protein aar2 like protein n=1 Tax=Quercus suber TaxID=58331 RepID=A0AAW0JIS3_QUESU